MIPSWCLKPITMQWYQNSQYFDGIWTFSGFYEKQILASVQEPEDAERSLNEEGIDPKVTLDIFTNEDTFQLIQQGGQDAVFFKIEDEFYFMTAWAKWNYLIPHWQISVISQNAMPFPYPELFELFDGYRYDAWTHDAWSGVV